MVACSCVLSACLSACGGGGAGGQLEDPAEGLVAEGVAVEALSASKMSELEALAAQQGWAGVTLDASHRSARGRRLLRFQRGQAGTSSEALLALLGRHVNVSLSERNAKHRLDTKVGGGQSQVAIFDDGLSFSSMAGQPALARVDVRRLPGDPTGCGVVVAVLDGGFRLGHEALVGRLAGPAYDAISFDGDAEDAGNGKDDDGDGQVDEGVGHGTAVAAIALAVAPEARILPVRVLDDEGNGTALSLALGILHAVASGADIINISACCDVESKIVEAALKDAVQADLLVIACAGNGARRGVSYPGSSRYVVGVAGIDAKGGVDPTTNYGDEVALVAPSVDVIAPHPRGPKAYGHWRGTSLAAPFAAGAAALVLDGDSGLDPEEAGERLLDEVAPHVLLPALYKGLLGAGVLDVHAALR
jgi:subtilisin family serine protease